MPPQFGARKDIKGICKYIWLFVAVQLVISFVFALGTKFLLTMVNSHYLGYMIYQNSQIIETVQSIILTIISGVIVLLVMKNDHKKIEPRISSQFSFLDAFRVFCVVFVVNIFLSLILSLLSTIGLKDTHPDVWLNHNWIYDILQIISVVIIAPIFEELIFRGMILHTLAKYNKVFAVVISSLLFGLLHLNVSQSIPTFFMGIIFAYAALKFDNLMIPIIAHALNNLMSLLSSFFENEIFIYVLMIMIIVWGIFFICRYAKTFIDDAKKEPNEKYYYKLFIKSPWNLTFVLFSVICIIVGVL